MKNRIVRTDLVDWKAIKPFQPDGLKKMSASQLTKLKLSLKNNGLTAPFYVWESGKSLFCLDGHHRLPAMKLLEEDGVNIPARLPANFIDCKNKKEAKKAVLIFNSYYADIINTELVDWVADLNLDELTAEIDIKDIKFDAPEESTELDDEVPEDAPAITKPGDLWELGPHRVLCGDSTDGAVISALMGGAQADMVFTDPPYNIETKGGEKGAIGAALGAQGRAIQFIAEFKPDKFLNVLPSVFDKSFNIYIFCNKELLPDYLSWAKTNKYSFNVLVWKKPGAIPMGGSHRPDIEYLLLFRKRAIWNGGLKKANYSRLLEQKRESGLHPTMKPVALITNQLYISSNSGSLVVDFFLGSGSTLIACEKADRVCYGLELDEAYCDVIVNRYADWCRANDRPAVLKLNGEPYEWQK